MNFSLLVPALLSLMWVFTAKTSWTPALLSYFRDSHGPVVFTMYLAMLVVWWYVRFIDPQNTELSFATRMLLWLLLGVTAFEATGPGMARPWVEYSLAFLMLPPMIVLGVLLGESLSGSEDRTARYLAIIGFAEVVLVACSIYVLIPIKYSLPALSCVPLIIVGATLIARIIAPENSSSCFIEIIEIAAWFIVFWLIYVSLPSSLFDFDKQATIVPILTHYQPVFVVFFAIGMILILKLVVNYFFYSVLSTGRFRLQFGGDRFFANEHGMLLSLGVVFTLIGAVPLADYFLVDQGALSIIGRKILASVSITGAITTVIGWRSRTRDNERKGYVAVLLSFGLVLLITAAVLLTYRCAIYLRGGELSPSWWLIIAWLLLYIRLAKTDVNYVSMHRYYRNRLVEAFLFNERMDLTKATEKGSMVANLRLSEIDAGKTGAPYHIINTNLVTVGSKDNKRRLRGGESFILSPLFVGSKATGWATSKDKFVGMTLATALAISGAAVDPNTGATRSWPLRIVMTWLNARLGYWCENPNDKHRGFDWLRSKLPARLQVLFEWLREEIQQSWLLLMIKEMCAQAKETWSLVRLSDGGHFENLGLYELARRKCRLIIVSDAGADPQHSFSDLAKATERVRVDFGFDINVNTNSLSPNESASNKLREKPKQDTKDRIELSDSSFSVGQIVYNRERNDLGTVIYLKSTLFPGLSEDVLGYARQHRTFPNQTTADQFFAEEQFEAYRELGYRAMKVAIEKNKDEIQQLKQGEFTLT